MRCISTLVLALAVMTTGAVAVAAMPRAEMGKAPRITAEQRWQECRFYLGDGRPGFSDEEVRRTIRCAFDRWAPGNVAEALCVAQRESGFKEHADNRYSTAAGVFQFVAGTWDGVHSRYHGWWHRRDMRHSVYSARANVLAAARYVADVGWAPWAGGC